MTREVITLAVMGMDQHENGAVAVARMLREAQMKVSYLGRFQTPKGVVESAISEGAQVIGISCHSWEYLNLIPRLMDEIAKKNVTLSVVIGGSVLTSADIEDMEALGVSAAFSSGASDAEIINCIQKLARNSLAE